MTPEERAALRITEGEPRAWFWPASRLTNRWLPVLRGSDEYGRRDLGIRVPGGMLIVALWRFRDFRGPCGRCGQWEPAEIDGHVIWEPPYCQSCSRELADYADGCLCPSFPEEDYLDEPWPVEGCVVHAHLERA